MRLLAGIAALALLLIILRDAFETIVLPRRVRRRFRLTTLFYRTIWPLWRAGARRLPRKIQDGALGWFGPLSLLLLLALWAFTIVFAFGGLHWSLGSALRVDGHPPTFLDDLYLSGTTFFTLGLGDIVPLVAAAKFLTVTESGLGFAFLAIIIGYLPVIYQAFSRREIVISLLDTRASSPPTAGELLWRRRQFSDQQDVVMLLSEWERWSAEVLESHLSYPVLAYFRSQHSNQSWLAALTTILDTTALLMVEFEGWRMPQAGFTFGIARHAVVDLAQVFNTPEPRDAPDRLPEAGFTKLNDQLERSGLRFGRENARQRLAALRALYEPYLTALSRHLVLPLPPWTRESDRLDNWEAAPWKPVPSGLGEVEHF